ncbi:Hypothetical protein PHPALM_7222 [Phytophthora palmivora]|uniref:Uncharacterized protein n=1 Tax=Phytophthora palmivora TaxID=4796 RepID=A0A2P4YCV9_9STRA|nr:Hypothetical protein PHPALM_7222 [Phytophthora palmivora]
MSLMYVALSDFPVERSAAAKTTAATVVASGASSWGLLMLGAVAGAAACALAMVIIKRWKLRSGYTALQPRTN